LSRPTRKRSILVGTKDIMENPSEEFILDLFISRKYLVGFHCRIYKLKFDLTLTKTIFFREGLITIQGISKLMRNLFSLISPYNVMLNFFDLYGQRQEVLLFLLHTLPCLCYKTILKYYILNILHFNHSYHMHIFHIYVITKFRSLCLSYIRWYLSG
jgi:hypothetical protein